jgi:hypothetical protein
MPKKRGNAKGILLEPAAQRAPARACASTPAAPRSPPPAGRPGLRLPMHNRPNQASQPRNQHAQAELVIVLQMHHGSVV